MNARGAVVVAAHPIVEPRVVLNAEEIAVAVVTCVRISVRVVI